RRSLQVRVVPGATHGRSAGTLPSPPGGAAAGHLGTPLGQARRPGVGPRTRRPAGDLGRDPPLLWKLRTGPGAGPRRVRTGPGHPPVLSGLLCDRTFPSRLPAAPGLGATL